MELRYTDDSTSTEAKATIEDGKLISTLRSPAIQYLVGLMVNMGFVVILLSMDSSYSNIQIPEGVYQNNVFKGTDVMSYLEPARNFLEYGVFGWKNVPDYHRTIGLPFYMAMMMKMFGSHWLVCHFFLQAVFCAAIYPALTKLIQVLFPDKPSLIVPTFCFYLLSAAYFARIPTLLSDLLFTVLFTIGMYFSLAAVIRQSWKYLVLALLFIGYAAQVRPTLIFYPIINLFLLWVIGCRHGVINQKKVKAIIGVSSALLVIACNAPTIRNFIHHGLPKPTNVMDKNLFFYLAKAVMVKEGKLAEFNEMEQHVNNTDYIKDQGAIHKKYATEIYKRYPWTTVKRLLENSRAVLLGTHWLDVGRYWGYHWKDYNDEHHMPLKKSNVLLIIFLLWCLLYAGINFFFLAFLVHLVRQRDWLFLFTVLLLIASFLAPCLTVASGGRMRLPVEGIIVMCAFYAMSQIKNRNSRSQS